MLAEVSTPAVFKLSLCAIATAAGSSESRSLRFAHASLRLILASRLAPDKLTVSNGTNICLISCRLDSLHNRRTVIAKIAFDRLNSSVSDRLGLGRRSRKTVAAELSWEMGSESHQEDPLFILPESVSS
jgi:hypothetical protein